VSTESIDHARVEDLWKALSGPVRGYLRKQTGSDADADDLLQEVFLRIHRGVGALKDTSRLQGWVYRIARNVVIDRARSRQNRIAVDVDPDSMSDGAESAGREAIDLTPTLRRFMQQLPDAYREPLIRQEIHGHSLHQISEDLGLTLPAAKSRVHRGRLMLREMLDHCCRFEFDRRGRVIEAIPRAECDCRRAAN